MKTATKVGIAASIVIFLAIISFPATHFINNQWALHDVDKLLSEKGYQFDKLGFSDISGFLQRKFPVGITNATIQKEFKDCDSIFSFAINDDDSLKNSREENYIFKVGLWGTFEIRTLCDSSSRLKRIDYVFEYSNYDTNYE